MITHKITNFVYQNRNITLLNLHSALQRFSNKTLDVFGAIYFLSLGISFPSVALAWIASFLIRFLLRPFSVWLSNRIGLRRALIFGTIFSSGLFLIFLLVDGVNIWLLVFALYLALYDILYWLPYNAYYAIAGDEKSRGKQVAFRSGLIDLVQIVVPILGAVLATAFGFWSLYVSAMICMLLSVIPIFFAKDESPGEKMNFRQAFTQVDKRGLIMQIGDGILVNAHSFLWTIVLFLLIGNLVGFGGLITFELLVTTVLSLVLGYFIDGGNGKWIARFGLAIVALVVITRSFWVTTLPQIFLVNFISAVGIAFYSMTYQVGIYNLAKRTPNTLWFHFFAEAGWDIGGALVFLIAAGLFVLGVELQHMILLALGGLLIVNYVLKSYYSSIDKI